MRSPSSEGTAPISHRGLAVVGIRLLALYLLLQGVQSLALIVTAPDASDGLPVALALVPLFLGAVLWLGVGRFASVMIPARRALGSASPVGISGDALGALMFGGLGLFLIADTLPGLISAYYLLEPIEYDPERFLPQWLRLLLGIAIFVGARGLGRLHAWLRYAGRAAH